MHSREPITNGNGPKADLSPGFLVIAVGGAGKTSALSIKKQHRAAGSPFSLIRITLDTDKTGFAEFDFAINIAPTREAVAAMAANPKRYGPACRAIVQHHPDLLDPETLGHGARTSRPITQAAFELFEDRIVKGLREVIHSLLRQGQCHRIIPVVTVSFGGGTGSAGVILLLGMFMDPVKKSQIVLGLPPDLVARPILFCIDGYSHALMQTNDVVPDWILGNTCATRTELAEYEKLGKGYEYVFHLGLGNDAGAVFSTIEQVCEANGQLCWKWMANYDRFKSRAVDGFDFTKDRCRYHGGDIPELHCPKELVPPYGEHVDDGGLDDRTVDKGIARPGDTSEKTTGSDSSRST